MCNLLLGNGLNLNDEKSRLLFSANCISERFLESFIRSLPIVEYWCGDFGISNVEALKQLIEYNSTENIEQVAKRVYCFIKSRFTSEVFQEYKRKFVLRTIIAAGINAIFYIGNKKILPTVPVEHINKINTYDNIYTLNYFEDWDIKNRCVYLHGKYFNDCPYYNGNPILLIDEYQYLLCKNQGYEDFVNLIDRLESSFNVIKVDTRQISLTPVGIDKRTAFANVPSKSNFPSKLNMPSKGYDLYDKLDGLNSISLFGVSPIGDKALIEKIKRINNITIYIFGKNSTCEKDQNKAKEEESIWRKDLKECALTIRDSTDFLNDEM